MNNYLPEYLEPVCRNKDLAPLDKANQILAFAEEHPDETDFIYAWAMLALRGIEDYQIMVDYCEKYLPLTKSVDCRSDTLMLLTHAYEETGQPDKAMETRLIKLEETDNKSYVLEEIAEAYEKRKDLKNAIKYYELFIEECEGACDTEIFSKLAGFYDKENDHTNAAKNYEIAAREICLESCWLWCNTGRALAIMGKLEEATFYFQMVLKIDPKHDHANYNMGQYYHMKGDIYRALHHYTEALKTNPKMDVVYNNLAAISYNENGNIAEAIANVEKALSVSDSDSKLLVTLYLNLSRLYARISDYDKQEYYKGKMMEAAGFPAEFNEEDYDEDDEDYEDDDYDDEDYEDDDE